jgi:TDG/mug DNA glycosylase family protein
VLSLSDVAWPEIPVALARLHAETPVGSVASVVVPAGPLRWGSVGCGPGGCGPAGAVDPGLYDLGDVIHGAGFEPIDGPTGFGAGGSSNGPIQLRALRTLPDVVGPGMRAMICGLNPSLVAADAGFAYAGATNRFWAAALSAGLVTVARRPLETLALDGVGITDLVKRASARSHHLSGAEYLEGALRVERLVAWLVPQVVIFVGLEGWRAARDRRATPGWQPQGMAQVSTYVMPSTSGANARTSPLQLVGHLQSALAGP